LKILKVHIKIKWLFLLSALLLCIPIFYAQPTLPQRTLTVLPTQPIDFGLFYSTGAAGTIKVDWQGVRTTTGGVIALSGSTARPAIFDVKLCQGRNVIISYPPSTTINNGVGVSLTLDIGPTEKGVSGSSFAVNNNCNFITTLRVGGTLHVPGAASTAAYSGVYSGIFELNFVQE
jgi:hypothetical protein